MKNRITKTGIALVLMVFFVISAATGCAKKQDTDRASAEIEKVETSGDASIETSEATLEETSVIDDESLVIDMLWDALGKLAENGVIPAFEENSLVFDGEIFTSEEAEGTYTQPLSLAGSKVIVGRFDRLFYNTSGNVEYPGYFPVSTQNINETSAVLRFVCSPSSFADALSECDYYIFYDGAEYGRSEDYYSSGADRVKTATIVVVVDAHSREVIRLYNIAVDTPGDYTTNTRGFCQGAEAELFISGMLRDPDQEDFTDQELSELLASIDNPQSYVVFDINGDLLDEVLVLYQGEDDEEPRYHIYRYLPNAQFPESSFEEAGPAMQPGVKGLFYAAEKSGIIAEYEDTFLLYSLGGNTSVQSNADSVLYEIEELDIQPVELIDITE